MIISLKGYMVNYFKAPSKTKHQISNKKVTVTVQKLDMNGDGVARFNNKPLFIAGALPSETIDANIIEQRNKYARATLINIHNKSHHRVTPPCDHFKVCGGCDLQMLDGASQLEFKKKKVTELFSRNINSKLLKNTEKLLVLPWYPPIQSNAFHYRRKARIGVQFNKKSQATIGFRQKSTNQLTAIKSCDVLVEPFSDIFPVLNDLLANLTIKAAIGHIELIDAEVISKRTKLPAAKQPIILVVRQLKVMSSQDKALWLSYSEKYNWYVLIDDGKQKQPLVTATLPKPATFCYTLEDNNKIYFGASDFIQVNHHVNKNMVKQAIDWLNISPSDHILDLFCGLGNFSLAFAKHCASVVGVEGIQDMVDKATKNAALNSINNCQFFQADLNSMWQSNSWANAKVFDKVLLDPARAGAEKAVEQISILNIPTILYVSCDPATLARDSAILLAKGYVLEKISLMDMFPQTKHVEVMVLFHRHH